MVADGHVLRRILDAHRDPLEMAGLVDAPLPDEIGEVLSLLAGQIDRLHPVAECLEVSPDDLLAAVRQYVREAMLFPDADDARMLGLALQSVPDDLKQHYRALQSWLHPDREGAPEDASALSARINAAWTRLRAASRIALTGEELVEFRPRWRKVEVDAESLRRRWVPVAATVAILLALGGGAVIGLRPGEIKTPLIESASTLMADSASVADPAPVSASEAFRPIPPIESSPSVTGTEASDVGRGNTIAEAMPAETKGSAPSKMAVSSADRSNASLSALSSSDSPASVPPQPTPAQPAVVASREIQPPVATMVSASGVAASASVAPRNDAIPIATASSTSAKMPVAAVAQETAPHVIRAASPVSAPQKAVAKGLPPSGQSAITSEDVAVVETREFTPSPDTIGAARTKRARSQGASLLAFLTQRKSNVPPIWHSGSAFDQAEQARRTLTSGRGSRSARPLRDLEHWRIEASHAEARIPVEPSDRSLDTQVVLVRLLWKNDDWWVENIDLETAK